MKPSELKELGFTVYASYNYPGSAIFCDIMNKQLNGSVSYRKLKNLYKQIQNEYTAQPVSSGKNTTIN